MRGVNARDEMFEGVEILGRRALFTGRRVDRATVPEGLYCYSLRHGGDMGFPVSIEEKVAVDYFGAVLTAEKFEFGNMDYLPLGYEDFRYTGSICRLKDFMGGLSCDGNALKKYCIAVTETLRRELVIESSSLEQAIADVGQAYDDGKIVLNADDLVCDPATG